MNFKDGTIKKDEEIMLRLRGLYHGYGYKPFKMSRFEEYDLYAKNKDFLVSGDILTFTDLSGKLLALKPDVTLSIIKNYKGGSGAYKVYYNENVYRPDKGTHEFKEIMQSGVECIGNIGMYEECEVIRMALQSLSLISESGNYILDIASAGMLNGLLEAATADESVKKLLAGMINAKNIHGLREVCAEYSVSGGTAETLVRLAEVSMTAFDDFSELKKLCINREMSEACENLINVTEILKKCGMAEHINIDFSILSDINYYSGIVFRGYIEELPKSILSGGRYDKLLARMGKKGGAAGFAIYADMLERLGSRSNASDCDAAIKYDSATAAAAILEAVARLQNDGKSVCVMRDIPTDYICGEVIDMCVEGK